MAAMPAGKYTDNEEMSKEINIADKQTLKTFIDVSMAERSSPYKRIRLGNISPNTQKLIQKKFGFNIKYIKSDNSGIIHALRKAAHNLINDDLLDLVDAINTTVDITLSPTKHNECNVLKFKKDIKGEITFIAEFHPKYETLLVFDAWREKPRKHTTADTPKGTPSANVQNALPSAITSLSSDSTQESSDSSNGALFQTGDRDIVEEAAGFDTWEQWRDYVLYMEEGDVGDYNAELAANLDSDESLNAWFKTFHENAVKAVNSQTETEAAGPRTPADAAAPADKEFLDIIRDDRAFDEFTEEAARIYNDSFRDAAVDEEEAYSMKARRELQDDMRRTLTHANWTYRAEKQYRNNMTFWACYFLS